jgi:hypothetical protein
MDWQWVAVAASVAAAAIYLARQTWRTWAGRKAGCGNCSCANKNDTASARPATRLISADELTARLRRR